MKGVHGQRMPKMADVARRQVELIASLEAELKAWKWAHAAIVHDLIDAHIEIAKLRKGSQ